MTRPAVLLLLALPAFGGCGESERPTNDPPNTVAAPRPSAEARAVLVALDHVAQRPEIVELTPPDGAVVVSKDPDVYREFAATFGAAVGNLCLPPPGGSLYADVARGVRERGWSLGRDFVSRCAPECSRPDAPALWLRWHRAPNIDNPGVGYEVAVTQGFGGWRYDVYVTPDGRVGTVEEKGLARDLKLDDHHIN